MPQFLLRVGLFSQNLNAKTYVCLQYFFYELLKINSVCSFRSEGYYAIFPREYRCIHQSWNSNTMGVGEMGKVKYQVQPHQGTHLGSLAASGMMRNQLKLFQLCQFFFICSTGLHERWDGESKRLLWSVVPGRDCGKMWAAGSKPRLCFRTLWFTNSHASRIA